MSINYFIILGHFLVYLTNGCIERGQRALARINRHEEFEEVPAGPREENPVESD